MKIKYIYIIVLSVCLSSCKGCKDTEHEVSDDKDVNYQPYIIGGDEIPIADVPWQVALLDYNSDPRESFCGGSIINESWIITAAHCVYQENKDSISIYSGSEDLDANGLTSEIKQIIVHPNYNNNTLENDIALIELKTPLIFNNSTNEVVVPNFDEYSQLMVDNTELSVSGWGIVDIITNRTSRLLMEASVPIRSINECLKNYDEDGRYGTGAITNGMFCASGNNRDSCNGDSGGPLFARNAGNEGILMGIASWGPEDCANEKLFGVYTDVFFYRDWINDNCQQCIEAVPSI